MEKLLEVESITIEEIIHNQDVTCLYQPIISLHNGEILGYEALSRGPVNTPYHSPIELIKSAEDEGIIWELEMLFRKKAIEKAATMPSNRLLFINVDPNIFKDGKYEKGFTKSYLQKYSIDPKNIVFEITERTAIDDYEIFSHITNYYQSQEYKIAIDDVGSGYSGLKSITELKPDYVKIDMDLIRDVDTDNYKQAIIKALVNMSKETHMKLIAEGVETYNELKTLIKFGVHYAQGFLLYKPNQEVVAHLPEVRDFILQITKELFNTFSFDYTFDCIGKILKPVKSYASKSSCKDIKTILDSTEYDSLCLTSKEGFVEGMIMKSYLNSKLADQYGYALYSGRSIKLLMDVRPLIIDYYTPVSIALTLAMQRKKETIYDDVIVTQSSRYFGVATIYDLIRHATESEKKYAKQLNPLTALPGNPIIRQVIEQYINNNEIIGLLYLDLDHFKAYNDVYGFEKGDLILKKTAEIIEKVIPHIGTSNFIGHIGGDDYFAIVKSNYDDVQKTCDEIIKAFDKEILHFFDEETIQRGHYIGTDRNNTSRKYPLTSLSIAAYFGSISQFESPENLGTFMSGIKKRVKYLSGSSVLLVES